MRLSVVTLFFASAATLPTNIYAVAISTVPVGDTGNPGELSGIGAGGAQGPDAIVGGLSYEYRIGKFEVTIGQYTEFLNAVARNDTYLLYHPSMATDLRIAGIARSGSQGSYSYSAIGSPNRPITYVDWGDAARFANWLHNGQPGPAPQDPTTTEDGAYTLNGAMFGALSAVVRNPGARWFIPTEDEWYKAAYYQPSASGGDSDGYWTYPMRTNDIPYSDQPPGATPDNSRVANYFNDDNGANGYDDGYAVTGSSSLSVSDNYLTDVGAYTGSASFYGTFDQGGNVWEWNETLIYDEVGNPFRGLRGGSWADVPGLESLASYSRNYVPQGQDGVSVIGFRVAAIVPEPATSVLFALGTLAIAIHQLRSRWRR